jgi:hypothetical protein
VRSAAGETTLASVPDKNKTGPLKSTTAQLLLGGPGVQNGFLFGKSIQNICKC